MPTMVDACALSGCSVSIVCSASGINVEGDGEEEGRALAPRWLVIVDGAAHALGQLLGDGQVPRPVPVAGGAGVRSLLTWTNGLEGSIVGTPALMPRPVSAHGLGVCQHRLLAHAPRSK